MAKVKVRVAVAVAPDGNWNSSGWSGSKDEDAMSFAVEPLMDGEARYWLTAELDVPDIAEIASEVSNDVPQQGDADGD